jgi:hypothetical protein
MAMIALFITHLKKVCTLMHHAAVTGMTPASRAGRRAQ